MSLPSPGEGLFKKHEQSVFDFLWGGRWMKFSMTIKNTLGLNNP